MKKIIFTLMCFYSISILFPSNNSEKQNIYGINSVQKFLEAKQIEYKNSIKNNEEINIEEYKILTEKLSQIKNIKSKDQVHQKFLVKQRKIDKDNILRKRIIQKFIISNNNRDECEEGYVDDCSGDGDCCPESWIGDGYLDCEDPNNYGCDLTCYDNDGGDCEEGGNDGETGGDDGGGEDCNFFDCVGTPACGYEGWIGDGVCDDGTWGIVYDCEEFNFDEGDCAGEGDGGGDDGNADDGGTGGDDGSGSNCDAIGGNENWLGDAWCDEINNNETCGFDNGDCCYSTCVSNVYDCDADSGPCTADICIDPNGNNDGCDDNSDDGGADDGGDEECGEGTLDDCSGDGDCCPEGWIGDGYADCEDQPWGCDLSCYDNDGGDCEEDGDDGGEWESDCVGLSYEDCASLDFCDWIGNSDDPNSWGMCVDAGDWNDDGGWDDGGFENECSDLTQDECTESEFCEWTVITTPNGVFEECIESGGWNDDGGWEDCDPDLACATVLTCVDGLLYPTSCGPDNCDDPIGECDDDGPPECVLDCPGIEDVNPEDDGTYFCQWLLDVFPNGCMEDCDQEILNDIEEFMIICDECLSDETCDGAFNDNDCSDLEYDECVDEEGCEPNLDAAGNYEGCVESNDYTEGCWEGNEFYCIGCEIWISECEYYECTYEGWSGPYEIDDCSDNGDEHVALIIGNSSTTNSGSEIEVPLFYESNTEIAGVQFTISDDPDWVVGVEMISHIDDCFEVNSNDVDGDLIGILFSLEGCVLEPSNSATHFATIVYELNANAYWGSDIGLYFEDAIVADANGEALPIDLVSGSITVSLLGDITSDGEINVLDVVSLINYILFIEEPDEYQFWAADINDDGSLNVLDVVLLVDLILE